MTNSIMNGPDASAALAAEHDVLAPNDTVVAAPTRSVGRRSHRNAVNSEFPAGVVTALCIAVHLVAASLIYRDLARTLYSLFDATPRLLVLEHGLTRLLATSVFLPPLIPTALVVGAVLWLGRRRRLEGVARWLSLALVPLALDGVGRAAGVLLAAPPANMGQLLDLPVRFSFGPRLVLDLMDVHPSANIAYWVVVATIPAAISAWCVARGLLAADDAERQAAGRRRRRGRQPIDALQAGVAVTGTWIVIAFAGQVLLPWATQLFLKIFG